MVCVQVMHEVEVHYERETGSSTHIYHRFHHNRPSGRLVVTDRQSMEHVGHKSSFFQVTNRYDENRVKQNSG